MLHPAAPGTHCGKHMVNSNSLNNKMCFRKIFSLLFESLRYYLKFRKTNEYYGNIKVSFKYILLCIALCSGVKIRNACLLLIDRDKSMAVGANGDHGASAREPVVPVSR